MAMTHNIYIECEHENKATVSKKKVSAEIGMYVPLRRTGFNGNTQTVRYGHTTTT